MQVNKGKLIIAGIEIVGALMLVSFSQAHDVDWWFIAALILGGSAGSGVAEAFWPKKN